MTATSDVEIEARKAQLLAAMGDAVAEGDIRAIGKLQKEAAQIEKAQDAALEESQAADRKAFIDAAGVALGRLVVPPGFECNGTLRKSEDGSWDNLTIAILYPKLADDFHTVYADVAGLEPSSARAITFTVTDKGATVAFGGAKRGTGTGGGGGGGRGKGYSRDGVSMTLSEAFESVATAEHKAELDTQKNSNGAFAVKKKTVLEAGFVANS